VNDDAPTRPGRGFDRVLLALVVVFFAWSTFASFHVAHRTLAHRGVPAGPTPADWGLAFDEVPFGSRDGTRLSAWWIRPADGVRRRDLAVVVLAHDIEGTRADLLPVATRLVREGFLVLDLDLRSHGASAGTRTTGGFDEADDVSAAVTFARARALGAPVALYGVGMGGIACTNVCLRDPTIAYTLVANAGGSYGTVLRRRMDRPRGPLWSFTIPALVRLRIEALVGRGFELDHAVMGEGWSRLSELRYATVEESGVLSGRPGRGRPAGVDAISFLEQELGASP
jgi:pimeloyl-ACP methyl ester carboxylesterase